MSKHGWLYKGNMNSAISVTMRVSSITPLKPFRTPSNIVKSDCGDFGFNGDSEKQMYLLRELQKSEK